jgi:hypothetical protein
LHDWKDDANEKDVHAALAAQLQDYILATAGNTHPCSAGESVASGTMAACNQLGGNSPQLSWTDLLSCGRSARARTSRSTRAAHLPSSWPETSTTWESCGI